MPDRYHELLKVNQGASKAEIRRAFRALAKKLHPDRNKAPNAHKEFILLNEAYDHLMRQGSSQHRASAVNRSASEKKQAQKEWGNRKKEAARERARRHARMNYEAFKRTQFYRNGVAADVLYDYFWVCIASLILLIPIVSFFVFDAKMLVPIVVVFIVLAAVPWNVFVRKRTEHHIREVLPSLFIIFRTATFQVVSMTGFNLLVYFMCTFKTLVNFKLTLLLGIVLFAVPYGTWKWSDKKRTALWYGSIGPTLLNVFFLVNFSFGGNDHVERYFYERNQINLTGEEDGFTIRLEHDVYDEYLGIRFFVPQKHESAYPYIQYHMQEGWLGFRIKKGHRLFRKKPTGEIEFQPT